MFRFPTGTGASGRALALFDLIGRSARYRNEIGLVRVDDAAGAIGGVLPGQPGWTDRALAAGRQELLFERTQPAFATEFREIGGDDFFALYLVPRGNADQARRGRRTPLFSIPAANPDGFTALRQHLRLRRPRRSRL